MTPNNKTVDRLFYLVAALVALIGLASFLLSYAALVALAASNGIAGWLAYLWPFVVDISLIVYTGAVLVAQLQHRPARLPIALTVLFSLVTIAGNVLHAPPTALGWFVAALPPLSLILGSEVLRTMGHHSITRAGLVDTINDLARQQQHAGGELSKLNGQIEAARSKLAELKQDILREKSGNVLEMNAARQAKIDIRRQEVLNSLSQGLDKNDIAAALGVGVKTIRRDIRELNGRAVAAQGGGL